MPAVARSIAFDPGVVRTRGEWDEAVPEDVARAIGDTDTDIGRTGRRRSSRGRVDDRWRNDTSECRESGRSRPGISVRRRPLVTTPFGVWPGGPFGGWACRYGVSRMSRHLSHSSGASWRRVVRGIFAESAWGAGSWLTVATLALIPALLVRGLWLVTLAEPFTDVAAATLSANVAGIVTWAGVVAGARRFFRRERQSGRHSEGLRSRSI